MAAIILTSIYYLACCGETPVLTTGDYFKPKATKKYCSISV